MSDTLDKLLPQAAKGTGSIHFYERTGNVDAWSYKDMNQVVNARAVQFQEQGFKAGDRIGILGGTSRELVRDIFAAFAAGGRPFVLPPARLSRGANYGGRTAAMLRSVDANFLICDERHNKMLHPESGGGIHRLELETDVVPLTSGKGLVEPNIAPEDPALIQFSSGTAGTPRPVVLSHGAILANIHTILEALPGKIEEHSAVFWLPLYHDMGLIGGLLTAVTVGGELGLLRPEDFAARPLSWLKAMSDMGGSVSPAPNFALKYCLDRIKEEDVSSLDLSRWRVAMVGAETVNARVLNDFAAKFAPAGFKKEALTPVYGLAEATLAVSFSDMEKHPRVSRLDSKELSQGRAQIVENEAAEFVELVSVGRSLPGLEICIGESPEKQLEEGRLGRIFVKGPSLMSGYYNELRQGRGLREWLDTGDMGFILDGELYIYGRSRDIIIINGQNHDPVHFEDALLGVEGLAEGRAAAFAVQGEDSEGFALAVERLRNTKVTPELLVEQARSALISGSGLVPRAVYILESGDLPRTTSGKVQRYLASRGIKEGTLDFLAAHSG